MKKKEWEELIKIICEFVKKQNTDGNIHFKDELFKISIPGKVLGKRFSDNSHVEISITYEKRGGVLRCYTSSIQFLTPQEKENLMQHLTAQFI
ncbi:MAG: hypothetical protein HY773_02370 [Candidatus Terrybacteria bacterium]|nr:hypothetical protein [Candidatus Terrybacteria bacterium]